MPGPLEEGSPTSEQPSSFSILLHHRVEHNDLHREQTHYVGEECYIGRRPGI